MTVRHADKTDLQKLKSLAKSLLHVEPELTEFSPMVVHHPFTTSGIVGLRDLEGNLRIGNIVENQEDRAQWQKQMGKLIDGSKDVLSIYHLIEKPYVLAFLKYAAPSLCKSDFSSILADAWIRSEHPNHDPNLHRSKLLSMFKAADPTVLMDADERALLNSLDNIVTVYRGVGSARAGSEKALSWTLNRETAQWFATRYGKQGTVFEAKIEKQHIHALFMGRNESEVVVDPKHLMDITQVMNLQQGYDMISQGM